MILGVAHFLRAALERWAEASREPSRAGAGEGALGVSASGCCASWRSRSCSIVWASRLGGGGRACAAFAADTIACKHNLQRSHFASHGLVSTKAAFHS